MPKIVNKEERRKEIALSCKKLFIQRGMKALTISEVAKTAGIGKGTIYEYFENKDDIIFAIVDILVEEKDKKREIQMSKLNSTRDKIKEFFKFFYDEDNKNLRKLYKEFISINLMSPSDDMFCRKTEKYTKYQAMFTSIIQEGVDKKEIKPEALKLANGLHTLGTGFFYHL
eukprot:Anaeramoba_flamelloidesa333171_63.p1 GENE.a333171_63~~a333171_63.p1  ORF type:complete len:171 (-),score=10.40 a333171_63:112-624(-)